MSIKPAASNPCEHSAHGTIPLSGTKVNVLLSLTWLDNLRMRLVSILNSFFLKSEDICVNKRPEIYHTWRFTQKYHGLPAVTWHQRRRNNSSPSRAHLQQRKYNEQCRFEYYSRATHLVFYLQSQKEKRQSRSQQNSLYTRRWSNLPWNPASDLSIQIRSHSPSRVWSGVGSLSSCGPTLLLLMFKVVSRQQSPISSNSEFGKVWHILPSYFLCSLALFSSIY